MATSGSNAATRDDRSQAVVLILLVLLLSALALGGGGSREDVQSLIFVRPVAILFITAVIAMRGSRALVDARQPLLFAAAMIVLVALQLVPLPPDIWTSLPGRDTIAHAAPIAGIEQPWRPLSMTPEPTVNSLVTLIVPVAAILGMASLGESRSSRLMWVLLGIVLVSGLLGMLQVAGGPNSSLYLYRITNNDSGVGLFSNRNHQAVFLSLGFPILLYAFGRNAMSRRLAARILVGAVILYLLAAIWTTGSRAGLAISILVLVGSGAALLPQDLFSRRAMIVGAATAAAGVAMLATVGLTQMRALSRLRSTDVGEELRVLLFGDFVDMAARYFPFGSGFGSFPHTYRYLERSEMLGPQYVNHAHMDWLEVAIEGGLPALLLLGAFLLWWGATAWRIFGSGAVYPAQARVAVLATAALMAASLVDYPLRAPLLALVFALFCTLMATSAPREGPGPDGHR